tara:strand:- start:1536 stop:2135 length:600 start_codon:yes stop_codon:yes gene_type:complete
MHSDDFPLDTNPIIQFKQWHQDAVSEGIHEPDAAVISGINENNFPTSRFVLVRRFDQEGFIFFTNYQSDKATSFHNSPNVALTFGWLPLQRQVRILGTIEKATSLESDQYFASRPRGHQIGAWSSPQSRTIDDPSILAEQFEKYEKEFADTEVPRPSHWGGFRVRPLSIEFWQGKKDRLHDRFRFVKSKEAWLVERLAP